MPHTTQVLAAANALIQAFSRHDTAAYFAAFADEASFIFHNHPEQLHGRDAYQSLWHSWEQEAGFRVLGCQSTNQRVQWLGDIALFTHQVNTTIRLEGVEHALHERESILFRHVADTGWLAVHEHLSPLQEQ